MNAGLPKLKAWIPVRAPIGSMAINAPVAPFGSNLSLVCGIGNEVADIVRKGDSMLKDIPLSFEDSFSCHAAYDFLKAVMDDAPHDKLGKYDASVLPDFFENGENIEIGLL